jgi:nucleoside-diphosphate-sugar epimerase
VGDSDRILVTGASGFIGSRVVASLLDYGFRNIRCLVRPSSDLSAFNRAASSQGDSRIEVFKGNLLSQEDCDIMAEGVVVIYHLAAGRGDKSYPSAFLNSVVTTRNLLRGASKSGSLRRFVNVSSFTVYSNEKLKRGGLLDESCKLEAHPEARWEAYCYAKVKQEEILLQYCGKYGFSYVILRPGVVYGPGNKGIHGRVGIGTFGMFLHLGGRNKIPLTYVDNCAEAIALAGIKEGVDGEIFNVVDDDLPTSRAFLKMYKKNVRNFRSLFVPYAVFYFFCVLWEKYSKWSGGQLPATFNRNYCSTYWKGNQYSNEKAKRMLGWKPKVSFEEGSRKYCQYQRESMGIND